MPGPSSHEGVHNHAQWCVAEAIQIARRGRPAFVARNCSIRCALFTGSCPDFMEHKLLFEACPEGGVNAG